MPLIFLRKKPLLVQAVQWTGLNEEELSDFTRAQFRTVPPGHSNADGESMTAEVYDALHDSWILLATKHFVIKGMRGEFYPVAAGVVHALYDPHPSPLFAKMKPGQRDALKLLARGHSNDAIGTILGITSISASRRISKLREMVGARDRVHLIALAMAHGVLTLEDIQ